MHRFQIIPVFLRTADPGDILVATLGNFSVLRPPRVLVEQNIQLPALINESELEIHGHARIYFHEGTFDNIQLPIINNSSQLSGGSPSSAFVDVLEAPPDGYIRLPNLTNESILFVGSPGVASVEVDVAPADGYIRLPALDNVSILELGSPAVANVSVDTDETAPTLIDDGDDSIVAGGMVGGGIV